MKKYISPILISILLFYPSQGFAEVKEIVSEGTYNMGDGETPSVAESRALLQAKRTALEQAGTYVESYSKVINLKLTEDEIQVLASGLMEVEILDKKRTVVGDGIHFYAKIKARVNLDKTEELANRIKVKDKSFVEDYKKIQEAYDKSQKDIEELKKELSQARGEKERKQVEAKIVDKERLFQANEWVEKGKRHSLNTEYDEAIEAYTSAIALNPNFANAYYSRGFTYLFLKKYDKAIEDFNRVFVLIEPLESSNTDIYSLNYGGRRLAYELSGYDFGTFEYFTKVFADHPTTIDYIDLGLFYVQQKQYDSAMKAFNKAIALYPFPRAYLSRGNSYLRLERTEKAIEDFDKAIALSPNYAEAYNSRGLAYAKKGQYDRAISDLQKACDMGEDKGCENLQKALQNR